MSDVFVNLFLGHLVGDFCLQSKSMAIKKGSSNTMAWLHVSIYTLSVLSFTYIFSGEFDLLKYYLWVLVIFIPHYLIDRYSLADKWLDLINGRSLRDFIVNGHKNIPENIDATGYQWDNYRVLRGGFTALVYAVTDNTFHLICLWYGYKLVF